MAREYTNVHAATISGCSVHYTSGRRQEKHKTHVHRLNSNKMMVVHCLYEYYDVYIGRWHPLVPVHSKWANPFRIGKDGTREEVIEKYRAYLLKNKELMASLHELDGKVLGCWCKSPERPETPCHGDVLIDIPGRL